MIKMILELKQINKNNILDTISSMIFKILITKQIKKKKVYRLFNTLIV